MSDMISIGVLEMKADALQKQLDEVRLLIMLARKYATPSKNQSTAASIALAVSSGMPAAKKDTKRQRIIDGTKTILSDGKRRLSRELIPELEKFGIDFSENKNPKSLLASYLSAAPEFVSDVKLGGWTLKSIAKKARPNEVSPSLGLSFNGSEATHHAGYSARKEDAELG